MYTNSATLNVQLDSKNRSIPSVATFVAGALVTPVTRLERISDAELPHPLSDLLRRQLLLPPKRPPG